MSKCIDHGRRGNKQGYSMGRYLGKPTMLHRIVFHQTQGYFPEVVRHTCDNPRCINPAHLVGGTYADNSRDMVERKRSITGENHPDAKLTYAAVRWIRANYVKGSRTLGSVALGRKYGVAHTKILSALKGDTWKSLPEGV